MATTYSFRELKSKEVIETITATRSLDVGDSHKTFLIGTDALVVTLPSTLLGLKYTFINSAADGGAIITLSPAAADGINGTITLAAAIVELSGVVNKDLINTKATATTGNSVTLIGTGVAGTTAWMVTGSTGIWASQG